MKYIILTDAGYVKTAKTRSPSRLYAKKFKSADEAHAFAERLGITEYSVEEFK